MSVIFRLVAVQKVKSVSMDLSVFVYVLLAVVSLTNAQNSLPGDNAVIAMRIRLNASNQWIQEINLNDRNNALKNTVTTWKVNVEEGTGATAGGLDTIVYISGPPATLGGSATGTTLPTTGQVCPACQDCPQAKGYLPLFDFGWYKIPEIVADASKASLFCQNEGAQFVTITSRRKYKALKLFVDLYSKQTGGINNDVVLVQDQLIATPLNTPSTDEEVCPAISRSSDEITEIRLDDEAAFICEIKIKP